MLPHPLDNLAFGCGPGIVIYFIDGQAARDRHIATQWTLCPGSIHPVGDQFIERSKDNLSAFTTLEHHQMSAGTRFNGRDIFNVVQRGHHVFHRACIKIRQKQMHVVQRSILLDAPCKWRAHHPTQQLGDIGMIRRAAERHHYLRAWAIPACGQTSLEEYNANVLVSIDTRGFHLAHTAASHIQVACVVHRVSDFAFIQKAANGALNYRQSRVKVGLAAIFYLNYEHRPYG
ncbi:hypothetical protein D3C76_704610 [compost metagenome]